MSAVRYPFTPLYNMLAIRLAGAAEPGGPCLAGSRCIADFLGEDTRTVQRWRQVGLTAFTADRLAVKAGFVPYELWPEWMDDSIANLARRERDYVKKLAKNRARKAARRVAA